MMTDFLSLIRPDLRDFSAYSSARMESDSVSGIYLNANESPWSNALDLNRYPQQQPQALLQALAAYYQVDQHQLLATRGSDEGIDLLLRLFCEAGKDAIVICPPTFGMYAVSAKLQGASVINIPLCSDDFSLDMPALLAQDYSKVKLVFLCSPNNPTGNLIPHEQVLMLARHLSHQALVVVDQAYIEFADTSVLSSSIAEYKNLVILRTFSKAFGLAAARVGVLLGHADLLVWLKKILPPYPLPALSIQAVIEVLKPDARQKIDDQVKLLCEQRQRLFDRLQTLSITEKLWPSSANFILVKFSLPVMQACATAGIILRDMQQKTGMANTVRITIGTEQENKRLIEVLKCL